jgi:hypothetical protein
MRQARIQLGRRREKVSDTVMVVFSIQTICKPRLLLSIAVIFLSFTVYGQFNSVGSGNCIRFDGVDDYIDLGNIYDDVSLPVTISVWLYLETTAQGTLPVFDSQDNGDHYNGFTMIVSNYPHIGVTYGDGKGGNNPAFRSSKAAPLQIIQGRWVHATGVYRGPGNFSVFLNGEDIGGWFEGESTEPMNSFSPDEVAKIGTWFSNGSKFWFKGLMDELRVYDRALAALEIRQNMCRRLQGNENGLIGYWRFDEVSGATAFDSSSKGYHGVLKGNPERVVSGAPIGDMSVFTYDDLSDVSLDGINVRDVASSSYGVHIYKVSDSPTQKSGLPLNLDTQPYYGVFLAHDSQTNSFRLEDSNSLCSEFIRRDNATSTWSSATSLAFSTERTEVIFADGDTQEETPRQTVLICDKLGSSISFEQPGEGWVYSWSTGDQTSHIDILTSGEYSVEAKKGCYTIKGSFEVLLKNSIPEFSLGSDIVLCDGATRLLKPFDDQTEYAFTWQDGSTSQTYEADHAGVVSVNVKNECSERMASVTVLQPGPIPDFSLGPDRLLCGGERARLTPFGENATYDFVWHDGSTLPYFDVVQEGVYQVTVSNACHQRSDEIKVSLYQVDLRELPNVITPNNDTWNEVFALPVSGGGALKVFNRWGRKVYQSEDYQNDWNGGDLPAGTYYWRFSGACIGDLKGTITIVR